MTGNHLRSSIARRAASSLQQLIILVGVAEAKVNDFDILAIIQQQVLRLQIPVNHIH